MDKMKIAVLGSGNGACGVAFECAQKGHEVYMFDFPEFPKNIEAISKLGGITAEGQLEGFAKIKYAGHDIEKVIKGAKLVLAVAPSVATVPFAKALKPYIEDGQIFIMIPGSCFGAIEFKQALGYEFDDESIIVGETSTLPYAARLKGLAGVRIANKLRDGFYVAGVPSKQTDVIYDYISQIYPEMKKGENIFKTALQNSNPIIHPSVMLSNVARVEKKMDWEFYRDGISTGVGHIIEAMDIERIAIGKKMNVDILNDPKLGMLQGYMADETYDNGYINAPGFKGIAAPKTTDHRYFNEDVNGLCLWEDMAEYLDIKHDAITTVINMASIVRGVDFRKIRTKTMKSLGFEKYTMEELSKII